MIDGFGCYKKMELNINHQLERITTELIKMQEYMNPYATGHFSARGLERLGEAAGKALGEISRTGHKDVSVIANKTKDGEES